MFEQIPSKTLSFQKGLLLEHQNIEKNSILYLLDGHITVSISLPNGKYIPFREIKKNELFGFSHMNKPNDNLSFETNTAVKISVFDRNVFLKNINSNKTYLHNFINFIENRMNMFIEKMILLSISNNRQKIAFYFICELNKSSNNTVNLNMTKSSLMNYLGISRGSFYREYNNILTIGAIRPINNNCYYCDKAILSEILEYT